jgi:FkbM family methyltransferase
MKQLAGRAARSFFRALGYDIINRQQFGLHLTRDLQTLLGSQALMMFDIGANLGQTSLELTSMFSKATIHAFEPDPNTFARLVENVKTPRVKSHNLGFGEQPGVMKMHVSRVSGGNSLLRHSDRINDFAKGDWTEREGEVDVQIAIVDEFCAEQQISSIDLFKMDTQGYELKIINGAKQMLTPAHTRCVLTEVLFVELYEGQAYFHELYKELTERGYRLVGFYNHFRKVEKPHFMLWCDALFVSDSTSAAEIAPQGNRF